MVIIGLGSAGVGIVDSFSESHTKVMITSKDFPNCSSDEDYEKNCPTFDFPISDEYWFLFVAVANAHLLHSVYWRP